MPDTDIRSGLDGVPPSALAAFEPPPSRDPRTRYLFFGGDVPYTHTPQYPAGGLWVESRCVMNQICQRCDITPVILASPRAQLEYIPEGMGIPGTETEAGNGPVKLALQQYYEYPGPVVTNLLKNYAGQGLVELENLRGFPPLTVKGFKLREFFFPSWPTLPKGNLEVIEQIEKKLDVYAALTPNEEARQLIVGVGEEMLRSIRKFHDWMQGTIDETHGRFTLGGEDRDKKRRYDRLDVLALERTGTARRDNELNLMARQSNDLAKALKEALLAVAGQSEQKAQVAVPASITDEKIDELIKATEEMRAALTAKTSEHDAITEHVREAEEMAESDEPIEDPPASPGLKIGKKK